MPCEPVDIEDYQEIGIYTPVEYNSNSLDFLSRNPTLFMRAADSVYMKGDCIIAKWNGGPYRLDNGEITHCGKALLVANIACKGNMPRVSLNGFSLKKTKRGGFGLTKRFQSTWVNPFGYPVLSRIGPVAAPEDCPETDLISLGHFATYLQWLTGSTDYGGPGVKDFSPVNSFIEYLLGFEVLGPADAYACGICPGSYQFENSDEEFRTMRGVFENASKSPAEHYALISVITLIAAGAVLKKTVPLRVAIPYGCGVWETYVTRPTPKADKLVIPQRGCDGWAYWLESRGSACFSIEPDPDPSLLPIPDEIQDAGRRLAGLYKDAYNAGTIPIAGTSISWPYCRQVDTTDTDFGPPGTMISIRDYMGHGIGMNGNYDAEISTVIIWFASPKSRIARDLTEACECDRGDSICTYRVEMILRYTVLNVYLEVPLMSLEVSYPCDCEFTPLEWTAGALPAGLPGGSVKGTFQMFVRTNLVRST